MAPIEPFECRRIAAGEAAEQSLVTLVRDRVIRCDWHRDDYDSIVLNPPDRARIAARVKPGTGRASVESGAAA
jgi:hypothetical protein